MLHGFTLAPLYNTYKKDKLPYVLNQTGASILCTTTDHIDTVCELKNEE